MTIHGLLRHVGIDVPDFIVVGDEVVFENKTPANEIDAEKLLENDRLIGFMNGPDNAVLVRLIIFFSMPSADDVKSKYLHPRELMAFWGSLTATEKNYYRKLVVFRKI